LEEFFSRYSAKFIVLFGSSAKGNYNQRSDLDLLIVTDSLKGTYFDKHLKMQEMNPGGIDFFVYSTTEFEQMVKEFHLIVLEALPEGIFVYDEGEGRKYKKYLEDIIKEGKIKKLDHGWKISETLT
jgi:predicted nucleotidyltransferase